MRISFDLDGTLFVSNINYAGPAMLNFVQRDNVAMLRKDTRLLMTALMERGWEICFYTNSLRSRKSLIVWAVRLGISLHDVINQQVHENKCNELGVIPAQVPSKMPSWFQIDLHVDDSEIIAREGQDNGFEVLLIKEDDPEWVDKVLARADAIAAQKTTKT